MNYNLQVFQFVDVRYVKCKLHFHFLWIGDHKLHIHTRQPWGGDLFKDVWDSNHPRDSEDPEDYDYPENHNHSWESDHPGERDHPCVANHYGNE